MNMQLKSHIAVILCIVIILELVLLLLSKLIKISIQLKEAETDKQIYDGILQSMKDSKFLNYYKLHFWLKSHGIDLLFPRLTDPVMFILTSLGIGLGVLLIFSSKLSILPNLIFAFIGMLLPTILLMIYDKSQNDDMIRDINFLYDALQIQLSANIYVAEALTNCIDNISNKRLRIAISSLCNKLYLGGDIRMATKDFKEKFNNQYINTFSNILVQVSMESGESKKLLEDISKQLVNLQSTLLERDKKSVTDSLQLGLMGMFSVTVIVICYQIFAMLGGNLGKMF